MQIDSYQGDLGRQIDHIRDLMCYPFMVYPLNEGKQVVSKTADPNSNFFLSADYSLKDIFTSNAWIEEDIETIAFHEKVSKTFGPLGRAFSKKYTNISFDDDARSVVQNWSGEALRSLSHVNQHTLKGHVLHIGSDATLEPSIFHGKASTVTLADISEDLVTKAGRASAEKKILVTAAEILEGVVENSVDLYVALRVYNSSKLNQQKAIERAAQVLKPGGSILLSLSNGYRTIDDTILPGEIVGTPPMISLGRPFQHARNIIQLLFKSGFRELFLVPGSAELFIGGTLTSCRRISNEHLILHAEGVDGIPLCFYSEKMPTAWLGNYSDYSVTLDGNKWSTVEHYFQAQKFKADYHKENILNLPTPDLAKKYAWHHAGDVRSDWRNHRVEIMKSALAAKFSQHSGLRLGLQITKGRNLVERSKDDLFWGSNLKGEGRNNMGRLLGLFRNTL